MRQLMCAAACAAAGLPPRGVIARPADVRMPQALPGAFPGDPQEQQQRKMGQGAVISGKSTVVPLPKAHEDKRGTCSLPLAASGLGLVGPQTAPLSSACCSHRACPSIGACAA